MTVAIVIPVKNPRWLDEFIEQNKEILTKYPVIVIDSGGGEKLKEFARVYIEKDVHLWDARKIGYSYASEPYILNLDADIVLPKNYIERAIRILEGMEIMGAVSVFFETINRNRGMLEYGCSVWKTEILKQLYDWKGQGPCECFYMWDKLQQEGLLIGTLCFRAKHLRR